jgi:hypothetical protein
MQIWIGIGLSRIADVRRVALIVFDRTLVFAVIASAAKQSSFLFYGAQAGLLRRKGSSQ